MRYVPDMDFVWEYLWVRCNFLMLPFPLSRHPALPRYTIRRVKYCKLHETHVHLPYYPDHGHVSDLPHRITAPRL